jgi:hypothetical protein
LADIETSVAITAQTDDLQSGMQTAANAVETATEAMKAQFAGLGAAAQQAQSHLNAAAAQIGSAVGALQAKAANLAGSAKGGLAQMPAATERGQGAGISPGISVTQASAPGASGGGQNRTQEWRAELQSQLSNEQAYFADSKAEELAFWQDKLALTESGSKEQLAVESNIYNLERQLAEQNERDTLASLDADEKATDAAYARKKAAIEEQAEVGKTSASEEVAQLKDLLDSEWALEQDYYEKKLAAATDDARTQEKLTEQEELAYQKYLTDKDRLDAQAVQDSQKQWQSLLQPIQSALDTSITGIIMSTTTVQKALSRLAQSIVAEFVDSAVKTVFGGLGKMLGGSLVGGGGGGSGSIGAGAGGNQDFWGGITGAGADIIGGGVSQGMFGSGGLFGALGLGSLVSGGGVFGSLFKGIGSLFGFEHGGIVPSAAGGWMVPSASLAMLHTNEMVLPANISQGLQSMIGSGGGGGASPGGANVMFNVSAMDSQSVAKFFQSNGSTLVTAINRAMRNGSPLRSA